jgi:hypothetical protein
MWNLRLWVSICQAFAIVAVAIRFFLPVNMGVSIHTSSGHAVEVLRVREFLPLVLMAFAGMVATIILAKAFILAAQR